MLARAVTSAAVAVAAAAAALAVAAAAAVVALAAVSSWKCLRWNLAEAEAAVGGVA